MDMHAADFGVVAPNGDRVPGGMDNLTLYRIQCEVLGRDSNPPPRRELVARSSEGRGLWRCIGRDAKRFPRCELRAFTVSNACDSSHPVSNQKEDRRVRDGPPGKHGR